MNSGERKRTSAEKEVLRALKKLRRNAERFTEAESREEPQPRKVYGPTMPPNFQTTAKKTESVEHVVIGPQLPESSPKLPPSPSKLSEEDEGPSIGPELPEDGIEMEPLIQGSNFDHAERILQLAKKNGDALNPYEVLGVTPETASERYFGTHSEGLVSQMMHW